MRTVLLLRSAQPSKAQLSSAKLSSAELSSGQLSPASCILSAKIMKNMSVPCSREHAQHWARHFDHRWARGFRKRLNASENRIFRIFAKSDKKSHRTRFFILASHSIFGCELHPWSPTSGRYLIEGFCWLFRLWVMRKKMGSREFSIIFWVLERVMERIFSRRKRVMERKKVFARIQKRERVRERKS